MTEQEFRKLAVDTVVDYTNKHLDKTDGEKITADNVFVVWQVKVLQNNKALLSTTLFDGMYYECTYNGDKNELYVDCYKKWENFCVSFGRYDNKLTVDADNMPYAKFSSRKMTENKNTESFEKSKLYPHPVIIPVYSQLTGKFICGRNVTESKHQQILDSLDDDSGKQMTDLEFAKYLSKMLLNRGEDCCSKCAFNRKDDVCDNHKRSEALDCPLDDDLCFVGLKRYAETQQTD